MANVFKQNKDINEHPNRNNFDLSHKVNGTYKFGTLYPVMMQPVVPGDSFSIDAAYDLKLMPVVFPVQTKMRAHMHFFYVRNKNLWTGWQNWISNLRDNSETPHPYIAPSANKVKTGSLYDHLGVPTTLVSRENAKRVFDFDLTDGYISPILYINNPSVSVPNFSETRNLTHQYVFLSPSSSQVLNNINETSQIIFPASLIISTPYDSSTQVFLRFTKNGDSGVEFLDYVVSLGSWNDLTDVSEVSINLSDIMTPEDYNIINSWAGTDTIYPVLIYRTGADYESVSYHSAPSIIFATTTSYDFQQYSDMNIELFRDRLHLNALPFRAYESIYNAYYRNNVVDPLKDENNQQIYNKYLINDGDGEDTFEYQLHQRNYELDFLTSSLPSPQQGVAPLVGMTALGDITIEDENGITTARATFDENDNITKVVLTSPAASNEHARMAMNIAASGMSINDFRNTNALQRLLETNIRKGYRYIDFIAGHFGKEPEYRELDMPEFIGGFSRDVNISTVVSQADTLGSDSGAALGQFGGYGQVRSASSHSVRHYCDDYGYIVGILSIVPTPCYSQLLDKSMVAPNNFLDYYFPEFAQTGLQPITYKEVAPIQAYVDHLIDETTDITDTFGYQRPNYDMIARVDEVHGEFRSSLRQFVINRIFASRPELGHDFLAINPQEINDIFVNTDPSEDTIIGEIALQIFAKRPVPRVVIPNLGR